MSGSAGVVYLSSLGDRRAGEGPVGRRPGRLRHAATAFEGSAPAPGLTNTTAATRPAARHRHRTTTRPTSPPPPPSRRTPRPRPTQPPGDPVAQTIEEIQGNGATSPLAEQSVITKGVVTAAYPTGGFNGYYLQTPGTGGALDLSTHDTSDGRLRVRRQRRDVPAGRRLPPGHRQGHRVRRDDRADPGRRRRHHADRPGHRPGPRHGRLPGHRREPRVARGHAGRPAGRLHRDRQLLAQPVRRDRPRARHPAAAAVRPTWPSPARPRRPSRPTTPPRRSSSTTAPR